MRFPNIVLSLAHEIILFFAAQYYNEFFLCLIIYDDVILKYYSQNQNISHAKEISSRIKSKSDQISYSLINT